MLCELMISCLHRAYVGICIVNLYIHISLLYCMCICANSRAVRAHACVHTHSYVARLICMRASLVTVHASDSGASRSRLEAVWSRKANQCLFWVKLTRCIGSNADSIPPQSHQSIALIPILPRVCSDASWNELNLSETKGMVWRRRVNWQGDAKSLE